MKRYMFFLLFSAWLLSGSEIKLSRQALPRSNSIRIGDVNITPLIYLNRMIITPHFDYGYSASPRLHLFSAGASLTFGLGRLLLAFPMEIGIDYSYNFGTLSAIMGESGSGKTGKARTDRLQWTCLHRLPGRSGDRTTRPCHGSAR